MIVAFADLRLAIVALRRDDVIRFETWNVAIDRVLEVIDEHAARAAADESGGKDELRRAGMHVGGDVPYGRQLGADGRTLLEHEAEAELLREARVLRAQGRSYGAISRELAKRGIVARTGKPFAPAQIRRFCLTADMIDRSRGIDPRAQPAPEPALPGTDLPGRAVPEPAPAPRGTRHQPTPEPAPATRGTTRDQVRKGRGR